MLYNINDEYVGQSLDLYGEFSEGEAELFRTVLREGDIVVEAGANIGAHTVMMAQAVGIAGVIHAFEPQRLVYQALCANIALNQLVNVHTYLAGCGEAPGALRVPLIDPTIPTNFGGVRMFGHEEGELVPVMTIDSLELPHCRLLKVDVEGMELETLKGAKQTITRYRPMLYVENDREEKSTELLRYMASLQYDLYWHVTPLFNPSNFLKNEQNVFPGVGSQNVIGLPSEQSVSVTGYQKVEVP